jgi:hypothetical protein
LPRRPEVRAVLPGADALNQTALVELEQDAKYGRPGNQVFQPQHFSRDGEQALRISAARTTASTV